MKRLYITLLLLVLSLPLSAQVAKRVEVTKAFAPEIKEAKKMDIAPNMVDTITLRPEIDYTITPSSFASSLGTHRFEPASATYWEYRREYPFYLKLGLGYPLNSVADFYATTHRADVGYLTGYLNHYGEYGKRRYADADGATYKDQRAMSLTNKVGVMGGKYFGRYTLAGGAYYNMAAFDRFPLHSDFDRRDIDYEDINVRLSFGDSFADYSHLNFKVYASADFYNDKSENFVEGARYQQMNVTAGGALAREITKRSALSFNIDYEGYYGLRSLKAYSNSIVGASLMYHYRSGGLLDMKLGAKVAYDNNPADAQKRSRWHAFPYLAVSLNINDKGSFVPYVEIDGELQNNSYYSLVKRNPYVAILGEGFGALQANLALPNTELYNVRFGVSGHSANSKFAYRFYADMSFMTNALYWYNVNQLFFGVESSKRNVWSLCAAVDYKPISQLLLTASIKGSLYNNFATVADALPPVEALLKVRYTNKRFTLGASAELYGTTKWSYIHDAHLLNADAPSYITRETRTVDAFVDVSLFAEWHLSRACTLFIEGNNLANMPTERWAFYREMGASFTVGAKVQF